ncbi:MAG: NfeD family protein [Christensenellaceae bacterium]
MIIWWEAMSLVEQIFAVVGIAATVLLVIQVILLLIGAGNGGDVDASADTSGFDTPDVSGDVSIDTPTDIDVSMHSGDFHAGDIGDVHDGDAHTAVDSGLRLFTLQGIIAFFAIFGWSGLILLKADVLPVASIVLAVVFGLAAMFAMAFILRAMLKLQSDGTLSIKNALGKSGEVYLPIHEHRTQKGKVSIMLQERLVELDAVTDDETTIPTGAEVTVVGISGNSTLVVRKK